MSSQSQRPERYQNTLLRILLLIAASEWLSMALEGWKVIRKLLSRRVQEGMYEILDFDSVLELQDPRGEVAVLKRRQLGVNREARVIRRLEAAHLIVSSLRHRLARDSFSL